LQQNRETIEHRIAPTAGETDNRIAVESQAAAAYRAYEPADNCFAQGAWRVGMIRFHVQLYFSALV